MRNVLKPNKHSKCPFVPTKSSVKCERLVLVISTLDNEIKPTSAVLIVLYQLLAQSYPEELLNGYLLNSSN